MSYEPPYTYDELVKKFWDNALYSHITLNNVERSALAELATKVLF